jgi:hypothetical protein
MVRGFEFEGYVKEPAARHPGQLPLVLPGSRGEGGRDACCNAKQGLKGVKKVQD